MDKNDKTSDFDFKTSEAFKEMLCVLLSNGVLRVNTARKMLNSSCADEHKKLSPEDFKTYLTRLSQANGEKNQLIIQLLHKEITDSYSAEDKLRELLAAGASLAFIMLNDTLYRQLLRINQLTGFARLLSAIDHETYFGVPIKGDYLGTLDDVSLAFYFYDPRLKENSCLPFIDGIHQPVYPYPCIVSFESMGVDSYE